jgi:hypothetical protein
MKQCNRWLMILAVACSAAISLLGSGGALAATSHENPDAATPVFSGIALFQYYSYSLDAILLKDATEAEARLTRLPWANVPEKLATVTGSFSKSGAGLARLTAQVDQELARLRVLREQSRLDDAAVAAKGISGNLTAADNELTGMDRAVATSGREFGVTAASGSGDLNTAYREVQDRINRIREMLALFRQLLAIEVEASEKTSNSQVERTELSLSVDIRVAYVGDRIAFQGTLSARGGPLAQRDVDILLNSSSFTTVRTDAAGNYQGSFEIPYWYQPEILVQALYYPRDADRTKYLASLSLPVRLQIQYYAANLEVGPELMAYPGRATALVVRFNYGAAPLPATRGIEVQLDGKVIANKIASSAESTFGIDIDPQATVGRHMLTVSAAATGRYAPSLASAPLEITKIVPVLDMGLPSFMLIPGTLGVKGRIYSELGPLDGTPVKLSVGKSEVYLISQPGGALSGRLTTGVNTVIVGTQNLTVLVEPIEPWYAPLAMSQPILVVNLVNSSGIVVVLIVLGIYLPSRLRRRFGMPVPKKSLPPVATPLAPAPSVAALAIAPLRGRGDIGAESQVMYWYHQAAEIVARIARTALKPQQTLREFAFETRQALGPAAVFFMTLTKLLERILYSRQRSTGGDVERIRQLSLDIKERTER